MVNYTVPLISGFLAGVAAGVVMGLISDIAYRAKLFRSSLFAIDGKFFLRMAGAADRNGLVYVAGIPIHLVTSGVFGAVYTLAASVFGLPFFSLWIMALYVLFLWLSMLFIALPLSGQGIMGRRSGESTWLEQLILHILFFAAYYVALRLAFFTIAALFRLAP